MNSILNNLNYIINNSNENNLEVTEYDNKIYFLMLCLPNILKFYLFYYKKFKFCKWDTFLINSPFIEETIILSLIINFIGLKCVINTKAIKNNFESSSLNDINDYILELENNENFNKKNLDKEKKVNSNDNTDLDEKLSFSDDNFEFFKRKNNFDNNQIEILNFNEEEVKIKNFQKVDFLSFDFESKFINYIFDTSGEGLNNKNKLFFFKLLQNEGNIIINDNINDKIQIDPRDISFMLSKSISINFVNIKKILKFNFSHGKMINFLLDFFMKLILIDEKKIKFILKKINLNFHDCNRDNYIFSIEEITNKEKFYNLYVLDL